jgi:hypothetical protein
LNTSFKPALSYPRLAGAALAARLHKHRELLDIVRAALPAALADRVADCVLSGRKLLIYTGSAAWASQLRFHAGAVLAAVNAVAGASVDVVVTRILPPAEEHRAPARKAKLPPKERIAELRNTACTVADDSLRQALGRLGATLDRLYEADARDD